MSPGKESIVTMQPEEKNLHEDTLLGTFVMRKVSVHLTNAFVKTPITPNQVSLGCLSFYILATVLFSTQEYSLHLLAALLLLLGNLLDFVDGELARAKNMCSLAGYWMDTIIDRVGQVLIVVGIVWGQYPYLKEQGIGVIGFLAIFNMFMVGILIMIKARRPKLNTPSVKIGKMPHIGFTDIVFFIVLCAALNTLVIVIWIIAVLFPFVWLKSLKEITRQV